MQTTQYKITYTYYKYNLWYNIIYNKFAQKSKADTASALYRGVNPLN